MIEKTNVLIIILLVKSDFSPFNVSNVHMRTLALYLEIRKPTIVVGHYYHSYVLCSHQKLFSWVNSGSSLDVQANFLPFLMFFGLTMPDCVCPSLEMIDHHCLTRYYSIFYLSQHLLPFFCEFNSPLSDFRIDSTILIFAVRVFLRIEDIINAYEFIKMAIVV